MAPLCNCPLGECHDREDCRMALDIAADASKRCDEIEERNKHVAEPLRSILNIFSAGCR